MSIQKSFRAIPIGEISEVNPKGPGKGELTPDAELDFLPMADLHEDGSVHVADRRRYKEVAKGYTAFKDGDVLLAKITPCFENNKIGVAKVKTEWAFGSTEFHVLRPSGRVDASYLTHFLRQDSVRNEGEKRMTGSGGQRRVPKAFIEDLPIPLPPLEEQRRITGILDQADDLRRLRSRTLDKLNTLDEAIFHEMFGDVRSQEAANTTLGECAEFYSGNILPDGETFAGQQGGYLILKVSDLNRPSNAREIIESASWSPVPGSRASTCPAGAIVFPKRGGAIGTNKKRILMRPAILDPNLMGVSPNTDKMNIDFLSGWFSLFTLSDIASGSSVPQLNKKDLAPLKLKVPDIKLQSAFSDHRDETKRIWQRSTEQMAIQEALFASLQHRAFKGEL
jgi:type I restriction enzyme S subunit